MVLWGRGGEVTRVATEALSGKKTSAEKLQVPEPGETGSSAQCKLSAASVGGEWSA